MTPMHALLFALLTQLPAVKPLPARSPVPDERLKAFEEFAAGREGQRDLVLGGSFSTSTGGTQIQVVPTPAPKTYSIEFRNTGTLFNESVLVGLPTAAASSPAPLMVMFHGFSNSENSCYTQGYDLFKQAQDRGWYVVAPLGAHKYNYGIYYAQENIEFALTFLLAHLNVDPDRVYGVGFSMGGGGALSYGARHLDPNKPRFAAIVNHTGGSSTAFVYWNSMEQALFEHPSFFGASPAVVPFLYSQASALDIDPLTQAIDPTTDLARNLESIPVLNYHAVNDPQLNLVLMTQLTFGWLGMIPGAETFLLTPNFNVHSWSTVDENTVLNYLGSKSIQTPSVGVHRVLADRDARWHHFSVTQDSPGAFTPFRWNYEPLLNRLTIDETKNLQEMLVHCSALGLDTTQNLQVIMSTGDGLPETTTLTGYPLMPQDVKRAGVSTTSWTWNSVAQSVSLIEANPAAGSLWEILP